MLKPVCVLFYHRVSVWNGDMMIVTTSWSHGHSLNYTLCGVAWSGGGYSLNWRSICDEMHIA